MYPSVILSTWTFLQVVLHSATSHAQIVPPSHFYYNTTSAFASPRRNVISQQDLSLAPPMPILDIGLQHMLGQMGANATRAENVSIAEAKGQPPPEVSKFTLAHQKDAPAECGPGQPCADASCCNSEGKCGFKPYNCVSSTATTCISNCDAHAMCGVDSLRGQQKCKLNLCCSYFGYCGTTDAHCTTQGQTPCQPGFGDCQVMSAPTCTTKTASRGRRVAYYQGGNVANRACDQVYPSQINTIGLTHLNFAFASIDPVTFCVTAADPRDFLLYHQFTSLSSPHRLQTWISIGGGGFSGPGPTHTTWSDLSSSASNRAAFISSLVDFMHKWGFQGADLDWEFPAQPDSGGKPEDTANLALLLKEMSAAFGTKYGISLALPTDFNYLAAFDPIALQPYVSFFNFMAYDLHGPWEAARLGALLRPQAALPDIESTLLPIWFDGIDANKLNLGLPYYGRGATVSSTSCVDLNCPYSSLSRPGQCSGEAGVLSLKEIQEIIAQRHLTPKVLPGIFQKSITFDDQWISYDDSDTVAEKTQWADQHCFGGTMIWSIDLANGNGRPTVSVDGSCGNGKTCKGSTFGNCCSQHGWCGSSPDYCSVEKGCNAAGGLCGDNLKMSVDGSCGGSGTFCVGSPWGDCCSSHSWCGQTSDYCSSANGCQSAFGNCS